MYIVDRDKDYFTQKSIDVQQTEGYFGLAIRIIYITC